MITTLFMQMSTLLTNCDFPNKSIFLFDFRGTIVSQQNVCSRLRKQSYETPGLIDVNLPISGDQPRLLGCGRRRDNPEMGGGRGEEEFKST